MLLKMKLYCNTVNDLLILLVLSLTSSHTYKHTQVGLLNLENEDFVKQMVETTQANFQVSITGLNRL